MNNKTEFTDTATLRQRARRHIEKGAVTAGYGADRQVVLKFLNEALATELVCVLRYRRDHYMVRGVNTKNTADEFLVHADEELVHADQLARRIVQLGGVPDFAPDGLIKLWQSEYTDDRNLAEMITENLVAERFTIDSYRKMIVYLDDKDPTTSRMLEEIMAKEEEHANEMASLLTEFPEEDKASGNGEAKERAPEEVAPWIMTEVARQENEGGPVVRHTHH